MFCREYNAAKWYPESAAYTQIPVRQSPLHACRLQVPVAMPQFRTSEGARWEALETLACDRLERSVVGESARIHPLPCTNTGYRFDGRRHPAAVVHNGIPVATHGGFNARLCDPWRATDRPLVGENEGMRLKEAGMFGRSKGQIQEYETNCQRGRRAAERCRAWS